MIWVRHGQSTYNELNLSTGWADPSLTSKGQNQALNLALELSYKYPFVGNIYTSDLERSIQTASIILNNSPWFATINPSELLRERNYGDWTGRSKEEIKASLGVDKFLSIRRGWEDAPENGESLQECAERVKTFLNTFLKHENIPIIVCHGNTIRAASVVVGFNTPETVKDWEIETGAFVEWEYEFE